jgi:hypothetical protein
MAFVATNILPKYDSAITGDVRRAGKNGHVNSSVMLLLIDLSLCNADVGSARVFRYAVLGYSASW